MNRCRKCGSNAIVTRYDQARDVLRKMCSGCTYDWTELPLDRQKAERGTQTYLEILKAREERQKAVSHPQQCVCGAWVMAGQTHECKMLVTGTPGMPQIKSAGGAFYSCDNGFPI